MALTLLNAASYCNRMRLGRICLSFAVLCAVKTAAQELSGQAPPDRPQPIQAQPKTDSASFTFKAITSLVVLEVVARDGGDSPVRDLTAKDLRVSEQVGEAEEVPQKISFFRAVDDATDAGAKAGGIGLAAPHGKTFCGSSGIYELSYYLASESRKDGLHRIVVTSLRPNLKLYYREGYKVEADKSAALTPEDSGDKEAISRRRNAELANAEEKKNPTLALAAIACYDTLNTASLPLSVRREGGLKQFGQGVSEKFEFVVPGDSLPILPAPDHTRRVQLDLAVCTFGAGGAPRLHFEGSVDQNLTESDYQEVMAQGFPHAVEFPIEGALSARLVVREPVTGALGSAEMELVAIPGTGVRIPEGKPLASFGTTTPAASAFCGDVYLLAPWTMTVPRFSAMDSVAAIYTPTLGVYSRFFTEGIPGVTSRTEWFGIDFQGSFGIDEPGNYQFELTSDDGAKLFVDDQLVVDSDGPHSPQKARGGIQLKTGDHRIRVAYFEGPRTEVALVLLVKPPR